ncbi:MAG TPA: hypothetical protein VFH83_14440 [Spirochaetia bacterium]|nr:hypothetical protein [Spirochaetia bacterium]
MAASKKTPVPEEKLRLYERLVATNANVTRKGDSVPYTSVNGHMFSYLNSAGSMALKLPKEEIEGFLKRYHTTLFHAYGIIQKEFVTVPDSLLGKTTELKKYFDLSYDYVSKLKPKPTKKPAR